MANHQLLDNITHKDIKVITAQHPQYGDNHSYARIVPSELKAAQADYPLFFRKNNETGQFEIIAMFGMAEQENLFLDDNGWHAHYLPLSVQRRPFLIGFQSSNDPATPEDKAVVHIDMDSPRISQTEGEPLFLAQGGQSPYLQHISAVLNALQQGWMHTQAFVETLQSLELMESVNLKAKLDNGENVELAGLYTIHEDKLRELSGEQVASLHKNGMLELIYMMDASLQNIARLIALKNKKLAAK